MRMLTKSLVRQLDNRLTVRNTGIALAVISITVTVVGHVAENNEFNAVDLFKTLWTNVGTELASIAITVLFIDRLIQRRDMEANKARLIRDFRSTVRDTAIRALEELRAHSWLYDGSLQYADLSRCDLTGAVLKKANLADADLNQASLHKTDLSLAILQGADLTLADLTGASLQGADLREANLVLADLQGADLSSANLQGAVFLSSNLSGACLSGANLCGAQFQKAQNLTCEQLASASMMQGAYMTDGGLYDGRYDLGGDLLEAVRSGIDTDSLIAMAQYYGVSLEAYQHGQNWARENHPKPRGKSV
jgi:uncharacterized protein YjbI with pentapeptide repeats